MKYCSKKILLCIMLILALAVTASAATLREMKENGEVTDGGIPHGDVRDGIVSDISDKNEEIMPDVTDMTGGTNGMGTNDVGMGTNMTDDPAFPSTDNTSRPAETTKITANTTTPSDADTNGTDGGMGRGLIITILVIIAVIVIILILLPKRR